MATVFASAPATYAMLPMLGISSWHYGIAIANDTDQPITLTVEVEAFEPYSGAHTIIQVPARSQVAKFIDEFLGGGRITVSGTIKITSHGGSFYTIGLLFDGPVFTTIVPNMR